MKTLDRTVLVFIGGAIVGAGLLSVAAPRQASTLAPPAATAGSSAAEAPAAGPPSPTSETRIVFAVTNDEQAHIQGQMLSFLTDLQNLNSALAVADREWIREIASAQAKPHDPTGFGQQLRKSAPEGFTQISQSLRRDFADLADASDTEPVEQLQERVALVTGKCVACHGSYAISTTPSE